MTIWLPILMQIMASLPSLITEAEKAFSGVPDSGPQKKQLVLDCIQTVMALASATGHAPLLTDEHKGLILTAVGDLCDTVVAGFNAVEAFLHKK